MKEAIIEWNPAHTIAAEDRPEVCSADTRVQATEIYAKIIDDKRRVAVDLIPDL